ncbi:MAG TPA: EpsG family protein [Flavipsychrobacter sp.]|nr:EpsG family protein [Flavipsychrobacter sp.]
MTFYYLILFLVIFSLSLLEALQIAFIRKTAPLIVCALFFITAGFRYETGVDWMTYSMIFKRTAPVSEIGTIIGREKIFIEPDLGYILLASIVKWLGGGIQTIFLIISFLTSVFIYKSLKKYAKNATLSLLLYYCLIFFFLDMSGMRQGLSLAIFFYSLSFVYERRFVPFILCIFLAALFHWSSIMLIPLYFVLQAKLRNWFVLSSVFLSLLMFFLNIKWLTSIVVFLLPYLTGNSSLIGKAIVYTTEESFASGWKVNLSMILNVVFSIIMLLLLLIFRKRLSVRFRYYNLFLNVYVLQLLIYFSFSELLEVAERMKLYFVIGNIVLLPYLIGTVRRLSLKVGVTVLIALYGAIGSRAYLLERPATIAYHPYQNYIVYKALDLRSTGKERLKEHYRIFESYK